MLTAYRDLYQQLQDGKAPVLVVQPSSARGWVWLDGTEPAPDIPDAVRAQAAAVAGAGQLRLVAAAGEPWLIEPFFPPSRLVILGGGHIGQALAEFAARTGFTVCVVDDRPSFADPARFLQPVQSICAPFPHCLASLELNSATFLVIVTRGHRHDLDCLRAALSYPLAYLGMIGSRRRVAATRQQLLAEGFAAERLAELHAPIGLDIGAISPVEIGVAILAELIACKRRPRQEERTWPDCDLEVLRELAEGAPEPRALVTVVGADGSTPRGVGAKLLVWADGRTLGSIGGGCSEAEATGAARLLLHEGGDYRLQNIELTAALAAEEGMACGGRMQLLLQVLPAHAD